MNWLKRVKKLLPSSKGIRRLFGAALLSAMGVVPLAAQQATFSDNFDADTTGNYPVIYNSNSNSTLNYDPGNSMVYVLTSGWNGSVWLTNVKISSAAAVYKTSFRVSSFYSTSYAQFYPIVVSTHPSVGNHVYDAVSMEIASAEIRIYKKISDSATLLGTIPHATIAGNWYVAKMIRNGALYSFYINNAFLASYTISEPIFENPSYIALGDEQPTGSGSYSYYFDNLSVNNTYPPAGCGYWLDVAQSGIRDHSTIQEAVNALPTPLSTDTCIVIRDTQTYSEQVTVRNLDNNDYRLRIMADPTFVSSAPAVNPPVASTAAFQIANASVTIAGINIISTNTVSYGILASSSSVNISSVNVISGSKIGGAGIRVSSYSAVSFSSITVQIANGLVITGLNSEVSFSTMTSLSGYAALYLIGSASNTVTRSYISNPSGYGAKLESGADLNTISDSTVASNSGYYALYIADSDSNTVTRSYISNPGSSGYGAYLYSGADHNTIAYSTIASNSAGSISLYIGGSSSNTITRSFVSSPFGFGAWLNSVADYNTISDSTITSNALLYPTLYIENSNFNKVMNSLISNPAGTGAYLYVGADNNTISDSTMTSNAASKYALYIVGSGSNTVARSYISNTSGHGAKLESGADYNTISDSTLTGNSLYAGLFITISSSNTVQSSYIQGSTAAYISNSTGTFIGGSVLVTIDNGGSGLWLAGGSVNLSLSSSTFTGGTQGAGIYLGVGNSGVINFSSNTIKGGQYGLNIAAPGGGGTLQISSITFQSLTYGATAINFIGGQYIADIVNAAFNSPDIKVNVNGNDLWVGSLVTMPGASGPLYGAGYESDDFGYIKWDLIETELVGPASGALGISQAAALYARAPAAASAVQFHYQVDTMPTMTGLPINFDQSIMQAYTGTGAFSGQDGAISTAGDAYLWNSTATFVFYSTSTPLIANIQYYWRVRAKTVEAGDYGPWSTIASFTTGKPAANAPVNNLAVAEVTLSSPTPAGVSISFALKENSVSTGTTANLAYYNTADWVFVKFSTQAGADGSWNHATLTGASVSNDAGVTLATDNKGVFFDHTVSSAYWTAGATVTWNYSADGVASGNARVKVFAMSMVKVPQGQFVYNAGDIGGSGENNYGSGSQSNVLSAADRPGGADVGWPSGYNSFYIMRYELTQGLYADFLNTIPSASAATLYATETTYGHQMSDGGAYPTKYSAADRFAAKNYLSTSDLWSFLSWAALRPMTEMEFEKAARDLNGDIRKYPWGDTEPGTETYAPRNEGGTHIRNFMNYNNVGGGDKVLASGRYMSGDAYRTAEQTGASPYGVADLAGNVYEQVLNCSYLSVPDNGGGTIAWPANWPADNSLQKGVRGGNMYYGASNARISDRTYSGWSDSIRYFDIGGRGARTP